jgi:hypothetical protein
MARPIGIVFYRGPSLIDGAPIVGVVVGIKARSTNVKTGAMAQTYIIREDIAPLEAMRMGADGSICGDCPRRSVAGGGDGGCYVTVAHGPRAVWQCMRDGGYAEGTPEEAAAAIAHSGRALRLGTYGDPGAIPSTVWDTLTAHGTYPHTGYTHRWRDTGATLRGLCMASVDTVDEVHEARALGFATFRVAPLGDTLRLKGEARCPASAEAGKRVTCESCPMQCNGRLSPANSGRVIRAHGSTAKRIT